LFGPREHASALSYPSRGRSSKNSSAQSAHGYSACREGTGRLTCISSAPRVEPGVMSLRLYKTLPTAFMKGGSWPCSAFFPDRTAAAASRI